MSRKGDPFDKVPMESVLKTLETGLVGHLDYATHAEARRAVFFFLEAWSHRQGVHPAIGSILPEQMEQTAA